MIEEEKNMQNEGNDKLKCLQIKLYSNSLIYTRERERGGADREREIDRENERENESYKLRGECLL